MEEISRTNFQIVKKLIGPINPVGETHTDGDRLENLRQMCDLCEKMIVAINEVAYKNSDRVEHSMKEAGKHAQFFLNEIGVR